MIVTSTKEAVPYTPPHLEGQAGAPVFLLRAGSVIERGQMEAELAGQYQAGRVLGYELREAIRTGVLTLLAEDPDLDRLLGLIEAEAEGDAESLDDDGRRTLVEVRKVLMEHWPDYRDLVAQLERRREIAPVVAFRRFCIGWENIDKPFSRGRDGLVTDAALRGLDIFLLRFAGNRAYALQYAQDQEGNSPRPSPSDDGPRTSPSDDGSTAAGKSPAAPGKKIRGSRSRPGSGR